MVGVKAFLERPDGETEIRRLTLEVGDVASFRALVDAIAETFPDIAADEIHALHWKDEDGDFIAFSSDKEFSEALKSVGKDVLKIYLRIQTGFDQPGCVGQQATASKGVNPCKLVFHKNVYEFQVDEKGEPKEPFWVWFFRACAKRCMVKAWLHSQKEKGEEVEINLEPFQLKENLLPPELREWMNLAINEAVLKSMVESQKECKNRSPYTIPPFFFHNINRCISKMWKKLNNTGDPAVAKKKADNKDNEKKEREERGERKWPRDLLLFFRRDTVLTWHKALEEAWKTELPKLEGDQE